MKQVSLLRAASVLIAPIVILLAVVIFIPMGCGGGGGGAGAPLATPTSGSLIIGLVDSPSTGFQSILLNVVSVRVNASTDPNVSDFDPNWRTIGAPIGVGAAGELQIDLNTVQNQVELFNSAPVPAQTYNQIELQLDQTNPGSVVPNCALGVSPVEGCIRYGLHFFSGLTSLRASAPIQVTKSGLTPLVIDFTIPPGALVPPPATGGVYTLTGASISLADPTSFLGVVSGSGAGNSQTVVAELTGTNQAVAAVQAQSDGSFNLQLPAAAGPDGTTYDLVSFGGTLTQNFSYGALRGIKVTRGVSLSKQDFSGVTSKSIGTLSGQITAANGGTPIQGATLNLLQPPDGSSVDCTKTPSGCVVVATASTDDTGRYPMPGNRLQPAPFLNVPFGSYALQITASGFDSLPLPLPTVTINSSSASGTCTGSSSTSDCSLTLTGTTISGIVSIDVPPPTDVQVLIVAEDSGTNNLESVSPLVTIHSGTTHADFTLNVPTSPATFDLIATAQDLFEKAIDPFTGHTLSVLSSVTGGATGVDMPVLSCVGHGSLSGTAAGSDAGTTVRLFKDGPIFSPLPSPAPSATPVVLMETVVGAAGTLNANQFSFCAPPDTYTVRRFENGTPASAPTTAVLPVPTSQSSPCPSTCGSSSSCPGPCSMALPAIVF